MEIVTDNSKVIDALKGQIANIRKSLGRFDEEGIAPTIIIDGLVRQNELLQRQNDELQLIKQRYENLIFAVGSKYPNESRHETALRYIQQAENRDHQPCGADNIDNSKVFEDALKHGVGVMSVGLGGAKHVPHDEIFDRQQSTNEGSNGE